MARGRKGPKGPKDPFAALSEDYKNAMSAAQTTELHDKLANISKNDEQNLSAMKADQDLKERGAAYAAAKLPYKEAAKDNSVKRKFIIRVLADRGDVQCGDILKLNASKV